MPVGARTPVSLHRAQGQCLKDLLQDGLRLLKDFVIPKTQDVDTAAFEHRGSMSIIESLPFGRMPSAIDFYREPGRDTVEIEDEIADNMLASEFVSGKLSVA